MRSTTLLSFCTILALAACNKKDEAKGDKPAGSASAAVTTAGAGGAPPCKEDANKKVGPSGKVTSCVLEKDFTIDGYTCDGGKMMNLYPDGKLKDCYLNAAKSVDGTTCKDGLALYSSGKLRRCKAHAARTAVAEGVDVRAGDWVTFYEAGGLKRLELAVGPNKVQGLPCKGYLNYFHENGKLKKCELSEDATIEGKKVPAKGDGGAAVYVCFDDKGKRVPDCSVLTGMTMD